jgi:hypothetical protein
MVFLMEVPWHGRAPTVLLLTTLFSGTFRKSWRSMRFFLVRKPLTTPGERVMRPDFGVTP